MADRTIDLRPEIVNIRLYRGDAWRLRVAITDPDGDPVDLTGATIAAQLRERVDAEDATSLTITPDVLTEGTFWIGQATAADSGCYDVQVDAGTPRTYVRGHLTVTDDITTTD